MPVTVPVPMQTFATAKQPEERVMPFERVLVAEVPVRFK